MILINDNEIEFLCFSHSKQNIYVIMKFTLLINFYPSLS